MAQLNTRGTLIRSRWDYFEHSNGWASVYGSVASGALGAWFANNSTGAIALDIYHLSFYASVANTWNVQLFVPPLILTAVAPTEIEIHSIQPDQATPAGTCGMYSAGGSPVITIQRISNLMQQLTLSPITGSPFLTLPPGWAIGVGGPPTAGAIELSMQVWYQEVLDNIAPAK